MPLKSEVTNFGKIVILKIRRASKPEMQQDVSREWRRLQGVGRNCEQCDQKARLCFSIFVHFQQRKFALEYIIFAKEDSKFCPPHK